MSRDEESSRRSREDMRTTTAKTVPREVDQTSSTTTEGDGKARGEIAPGHVLSLISDEMA